MSSGHSGDFESLSLWELFRMEVEGQALMLEGGLEEAARSGGAVTGGLEELTRAAHSLKGAARIVGCEPGVRVAAAMEECLRNRSKTGGVLSPVRIEQLRRGTELLRDLGRLEESAVERWAAEHGTEVTVLAAALTAPEETVSLRAREAEAAPPLTGAGGGGQAGLKRPVAEEPRPSAGTRDQTPLTEYFRLEVESQAAVLTEGLLALERDPASGERLQELMRAAHSLKGAAQIVGYEGAVRLAHAMEDCLVSAQKQALGLPAGRMDALFEGVDRLLQFGRMSEAEAGAWTREHGAELEALVSLLAGTEEIPRAGEGTGTPPAGGDAFAAGHGPGREQEEKGRAGAPAATDLPVTSAEPVPAPPATPPSGAGPAQIPATGAGAAAGRTLRITADNLNRLQGLAGETLLASRWVQGFTAELIKLKRRQDELARSVNALRELLAPEAQGGRAEGPLMEVHQRLTESRAVFLEHLAELDLFDRRFGTLASRLQREVLDCRMRPFVDGVQGLARSVRDLARTLRKDARLEIVGETVPVDRDILERLEAPLGHLLRNALDHGLEEPSERVAAGKPGTGTVRLEARHSAGRLLIEVSDDGRGVDPEAIRRTVVRRKLSTEPVAARMSSAELFEFLFLPGFSMKESVTQISGRGVGLDAVATMVKEVGGSVRVSSQPGRGTQFQLQLPLTLSVVRTLLVEVDGEPYAFPLSRISNALKLSRSDIESVEGRQHFALEGNRVGLITVHQVLGLEGAPAAEDLSVVVLGDRANLYGLVVDRFLGERELVVLPLDPRLGKVQDISAAALLPDRTPVLIFDVEDLTRSVENLVSGGRLVHVRGQAAEDRGTRRKRVLVVDDSLTVRELERKLLAGRGYDVEVAVDGMDGWNAVRTGSYDLVVTDVDMPRLDGIELVTLIRRDSRLQAMPVMIVSYKDREEDRRRGLEAGADYYLTKGSFQDETLIHAVRDLIGDAQL